MSNNVPAPDVLTPLLIALIGFPILFVANWMFISLLLSKVGGWRRLAGRYRSENRVPANGRRVGSIHAMVGVVSYRNSINLTVASDGLYLELSKIFAFGHPTLFVPWSDIRYGGKAMLPRLVGHELQIGNPVLARLRVSDSVLKQLPLPAKNLV
jgi:hypothetical protein